MQATASKKIQAPREVICFCTAVIVEAVGAMPILENVIVKKVLPFVYEGFNAAMNGGDDDHKVNALMFFFGRIVIINYFLFNSVPPIAEYEKKK